MCAYGVGPSLICLPARRLFRLFACGVGLCLVCLPARRFVVCVPAALAFSCFLSLTVSRIFRATAAMNGADVALVAVRAGYATS